jgi:hypothetical protein
MRLLFLAAPILVVSLQAHDPVTTKLTWSREISRIVYQRCLPCHAKGGAAPMPLSTYADARPWAKAIKDEVLNRRMPPWGAVKGFGDFRNDPSLTQDEIMRIAEWVEGGAPEGDPAYLPVAPTRSSRTEAPAGRRVSSIRGPVTLLAIRPRSSIPSVQLTANLPDGSTLPLLWLRDYKQAWRHTFVYREPIDLPRGTTVTAYPKFQFEYIVAPARRVR